MVFTTLMLRDREERPVQVYAVTLYIDDGAAVPELQGLGSISQPASNPDDLADALLKGQFRFDHRLR